MITECPNCKKIISVNLTGANMCPKCKALVFIGNPLKDEENKTIKTAVELNLEKIKTEKSNQNQKREPFDFFHPSGNAKKNPKSGFFKGTPWDNWQETGFTEAFVKTTREIVLNPDKFFKDMKHTVNPSLMPIYGIILAFASVLFQTFWILKLFQKYFPDFATFKNTFITLSNAGYSILTDENKLRVVYNQMYPDSGTLFFHLLLTPFMSIIITAFILHLGSVILGSKTRLTHFYRMSSFIMVTGALSIFPFIGNIFGFLWRIFLVYKGSKILNNFDSKKASFFTGFYILMQLIFSTVGII